MSIYWLLWLIASTVLETGGGRFGAYYGTLASACHSRQTSPELSRHWRSHHWKRCHSPPDHHPLLPCSSLGRHGRPGSWAAGKNWDKTIVIQGTCNVESFRADDDVSVCPMLSHAPLSHTHAQRSLNSCKDLWLTPLNWTLVQKTAMCQSAPLKICQEVNGVILPNLMPANCRSYMINLPCHTYQLLPLKQWVFLHSLTSPALFSVLEEKTKIWPFLVPHHICKIQSRARSTLKIPYSDQNPTSKYKKNEHLLLTVCLTGSM